MEVREATPDEYAEAGRVTAEAYREFIRPGDEDWERYLQRIADVAARAERTTIMVAVEDGRVLGSLTLELDGRVRTRARRSSAPSNRGRPTSGCSGWIRRRGPVAWLGR